ncbi:hypothetical protein GCM10010328_09570 [Streptomyces rubiginosohelvolus]|uniref:Uncharacterized protein n=1 Tax=Streptomyces rubiginosohelvolus TaxID=67362 RepID=A0ABQ3BEC7_9ACTN|nr:hypothetical protein GCM10010328_09570 [Streptomyces pluricolorescens]
MKQVSGERGGGSFTACLLHRRTEEAAPSPYVVGGGTRSAAGRAAGVVEPYHRAVRLAARWYGDLVAALLGGVLPVRPGSA